MKSINIQNESEFTSIRKYGKYSRLKEIYFKYIRDRPDWRVFYKWIPIALHLEMMENGIITEIILRRGTNVNSLYIRYTSDNHGTWLSSYQKFFFHQVETAGHLDIQVIYIEDGMQPLI